MPGLLTLKMKCSSAHACIVTDQLVHSGKVLEQWE